ncbi:MAG: hypothetical protein V1760_02485 [Candidatus Peregrinibacteria bacterium]
MKPNSTKNKGLSILEGVIGITILLVIITSTLLSLSYFLNKNQLNAYATQVTQVLRKAQGNALSGYENSPWGVQMDANNKRFILFKGTSYAERNAAFDEITQLSTALSVKNIALNGGGTGMVFAKITGKTNHYGSFDIEESTTAEKVTFTINAYGRVEVN